MNSGGIGHLRADERYGCDLKVVVESQLGFRRRMKGLLTEVEVSGWRSGGFAM